MMKPGLAMGLGGWLGFVGVCLGAFGAHGLGAMLRRHGMVDTWETAVFYHLVHAVMLCLVAGRTPFRSGPCWCFLFGVVLFSGSLYMLALTQLRWLGAITPLGGLSLLLGWAWLAVGSRCASSGGGSPVRLNSEL